MIKSRARDVEIKNKGTAVNLSLNSLVLRSKEDVAAAESRVNQFLGAAMSPNITLVKILRISPLQFAVSNGPPGMELIPNWWLGYPELS